MTTLSALASTLGVSRQTIDNQKEKGYAPSVLGCGDIDIEGSIHEYVKFQSETIRKLMAERRRKGVSNSPNSHDENSDDEVGVNWKEEKEKEGAIKLRLQNQKDLGELVPADAMTELYNGPLTLVKNELLDIANQLQKRMQVKPAEAQMIDDVVRNALEGLREKGKDELLPLIEQTIQRYSKYHNTAAQGEDYLVGDDA